MVARCFFACGAQRRDSKNQVGDEPGTLEERLVKSASFSLSDSHKSFCIPGHGLCQNVWEVGSCRCNCWSVVSVAKQGFETHVVG